MNGASIPGDPQIGQSWSLNTDKQDEPLANKPLSRMSGSQTSSETAQGGSIPNETILRNSLDYNLDLLKDTLQSQGISDGSSHSSLLFANLRVRQAETGVGTQPTVGDVFKKPVHFLKHLLSRSQSPERAILDGIDGVVNAGEMLLVLGRPPSASSTLLKLLGCLSPSNLKVEGDIKYNGIDTATFKARFEGDSIYLPDVDNHFPHLLVGDTLDFAFETTTPWAKGSGETRARFLRSMTDAHAQLLGLTHTLQTKVGNEFVRGISGGERKRVSLAEALATRSSVAVMDNPTHGLDSSTALEFIQLLRKTTTTSQRTVVVALYQAGENLFREFDKVTVLYLGRQIFFGSVADSKRYFENLGFLCRPQQTTADFLTAITDPIARRAKEEWESRVPRSPEDFVKLWKASPQFAQLQRDMRQFADRFSDVDSELHKYEAFHSMSQSKHQRQKSIYTVDLAIQFHANVKRAFRRLIGDKAFLGAMAFSSIFMSLITGSLFYNVPRSTDGFFSKGGALFFAVLFNVFTTLSEISTLFAQRPIVGRQRTYAMYHPYVDALASVLVEYPYKLINITVFDIVVYWMVGLRPTPSAFFVLWLTTYLINLTMSAYFRTLAIITNTPESAIGLAGMTVLPFAIYTGYLIPKPSMHPWFKWLTYIDPLQYAFETLVANEFHDTMASCASLIPSGPGYANVSRQYQVCAVTGSKPGQEYVNGADFIELSFGYTYSHVWRNIGIMCAFLSAFILILAVATEFRASSAGHIQDRLNYRKGHEPDHVKALLKEAKEVNDSEAQTPEPTLTEMKTNVSKFERFVTSRNVLTWDDVTYDIPLTNGSQRRLLDKVTGYVKPGTLTALMGESGAGKTTLLQVLAERVNTGVVGGTRLVNGLPPDRTFQRKIGYVQQQDVHLSSSTVREALQFSAKLRQPKETPLSEKLDYVERVMEMLEMQDFAEAIIGEPGNGLNIEQRKRTTIAVELVAKPEILLFLDEPTSGLDSLSAWSIVRLLRKLANSGQAILCTIHQPSSLIFEQFDRLLLLAKGGRPVYFGDIGDHSRTVLGYFESHGAVSCPTDGNPAEYILDVIGAGSNSTAKTDWNAIWAKTEGCERVMQDIRKLHDEHAVDHQGGSEAQESESQSEGDYAEPWWTQYRAFQSRLYLHYWRTPSYVMGKMMLNVVTGLFLGFTFYKEDSSVQGLQNKLFAAFTSVILAMPLMNQLQPQFASQVQLFTAREKSSNMYHWSTFVVSSLVTETSLNLVGGMLFFLPWYFAIGFYRGWPHDSSGQRGVYMWLMTMLFEMWFSTFGVAVASLAPNPQTAATLTTFFASFVVAFNGILQPLSQLPQFWHFMYHLSPYTYLLGGQISTALHGVPVVCGPREINLFEPPPGQTCGEYAGAFVRLTGTLLNPAATAACEFCRFADGDQYLETRNMDYALRWRNLGIVVAYVGFNAAVAFALFYLAKVVTWDVHKLMFFMRRTAGKRHVKG